MTGFAGEDNLVREVERGAADLARSTAYGNAAIQAAVDRLRGDFTKAVRAVFAADGKTEEQVEQLVNAMLEGALRLCIQQVKAPRIASNDD